jgi:hypothetical protein
MFLRKPPPWLCGRSRPSGQWVTKNLWTTPGYPSPSARSALLGSNLTYPDRHGAQRQLQQQSIPVVLRDPLPDDSGPGYSQATPGLDWGQAPYECLQRGHPQTAQSEPSSPGDDPSHSPAPGGGPPPERPRSEVRDPRGNTSLPPQQPPPPPRPATGPIRPTWTAPLPSPPPHLLDPAGSQGLQQTIAKVENLKWQSSFSGSVGALLLRELGHASSQPHSAHPGRKTC